MTNIYADLLQFNIL